MFTVEFNQCRRRFGHDSLSYHLCCFTRVLHVCSNLADQDNQMQMDYGVLSTMLLSLHHRSVLAVFWYANSCRHHPWNWSGAYG
jgi:hypothetical protein